MATTTTKDPNNLHVFFLPYFTTSHLIPLVDTARLFSSRGIHVTIATTPANLLLLHSSVLNNPKITLKTLTFPENSGLPPNVENFSHVTSRDMSDKLGLAIHMLQKPMEDLIRASSPDCIVSDMFYPWTVELAEELGVPRLVLHASNCFLHCVHHSLDTYSPHNTVDSDTELFFILGLPNEIEMKRSQLEDHRKKRTMYGEMMKIIKESEKRSYGVILTSYRELENAYVDHFKTVLGQRCWLLGLPADVINSNRGVESENNGKCEDQKHKVLSWLDCHGSSTVLYVCFGSMIQFPDTQLREIALALEGSGHPFVWVVRKKGESEEDFLPVGFEERIKENNRGLIVREWAPQAKILSHVAVGGFMSHCGWNSILESIMAGVPVITWPLFAEQFYNELLITRVMKIGVGVGSDVWNESFEIKSPIVEKDKIVKAIDRLMSGSDEAGEIRRRVKEFSVMAKGAAKEGGSVWRDLDRLIDDIKLYGLKK